MQRAKGKEPLRQAVERLDERLWHQLEKVWRLAEEGIRDAQTSKDGREQATTHCRAIEENLAALIPDEWKGTRLTAADLFVLSAAAALHDAGKAGDSPGDHGHVSVWEVRDRAASLGLDEGQAEAVGWIVRAHNGGDLEPLPADPVPLGVAKVELRPLAALFKLADALDTDHGRVSRRVAEPGAGRAEDSPRTRFRLRVRSWRFDDLGRIELYAVPEDWDDVALIHTGFGMVRRELERVVPSLRNAGLPWELALRVDEADLERKPGREIEPERRAWRAFVGLEHFIEADAPRFKGRDDDARALWRQVLAVPVTLLVGDSGVGKTSLIQAGLFPRLHQARWRTAYVRSFDDPDRFVVRDLWRELLERGSPPDAMIVDALSRAAEAVGSDRLLVVLDQFEDVIRAPLPDMLDGLRRALVAVQAGRFRNLRLLVSYRADAEAALGPLFQDVTGSDRGLPRTYLQPLGRDGARAALARGFADAQVVMDGALLDAIADELQVQTPTPGVYPPHVQIVGETLCQAARAENEGILTEELYHAEGGCEAIIGHYLPQRLAEYGEREEEARRVLIALVRSTGVGGQRSSEELETETKLDAEALAQVLAGLANRRMVRHLGGGRYEIVHDHLAQLVNRELVDAGERRLKRLRELLDVKARAYTTNHVPLQPAEMAELYAVREEIAPDDDQRRLLLHTCLMERGPAWFWLQGAPKASVVPLLRDALVSPVRPLRRSAASVVAQVTGRDAVPDLQALLTDSDWTVRRAAADALAQAAGREAVPDLRELLRDEDGYVRRAAADALARVLQQLGPEAVPDLRALLKDEGRDVRRAAAEALAQVAGREDIPDLQALVKDEVWSRQGFDVDAREPLAQALQRRGRAAIPDLRALLQDEGSVVRQEAAWALAQVAGREAIPDLRALLRDENVYVRGAAAKALAQVTGREAIPDLQALLRDGDRAVRWAAAEALKELVVEDDLSWLAEWVASYPLAQVGEMANRVLIHLDRKLYFPGGELCSV